MLAAIIVFLILFLHLLVYFYVRFSPENIRADTVFLLLACSFGITFISLVIRIAISGITSLEIIFGGLIASFYLYYFMMFCRKIVSRS